MNIIFKKKIYYLLVKNKKMIFEVDDNLSEEQEQLALVIKFILNIAQCIIYIFWKKSN